MSYTLQETILVKHTSGYQRSISVHFGNLHTSSKKDSKFRLTSIEMGSVFGGYLSIGRQQSYSIYQNPNSEEIDNSDTCRDAKCMLEDWRQSHIFSQIIFSMLLTALNLKAFSPCDAWSFIQDCSVRVKYCSSVRKVIDDQLCSKRSQAGYTWDSRVLVQTLLRRTQHELVMSWCCWRSNSWYR